MPLESYFKYKNYTLWLGNGFLIAYELFLFEELQEKYDAVDLEVSELKSLIADDALYMEMIEYIGCIDFDEDIVITDRLLQILVSCTDNIIAKASINNKYLTSLHIDEQLNKAKAYLISQERNMINKNSLNTLTENSDRIIGKFGKELPQANYLHAFFLIKRLFKGEIMDSDINGLLVG